MNEIQQLQSLQRRYPWSWLFLVVLLQACFTNIHHQVQAFSVLPSGGRRSTLSSSSSLLRKATTQTQSTRTNRAWFLSSKKSSVEDEKAVLEGRLQESLQLLYVAAETKTQDSDAVFEALQSLERDMRKAAQLDSTITERLQEQLTGDWRLIFTTGTAKTQARTGRINYFPLKAIQSFDNDSRKIENGIYVGDFCVLKFLGDYEFDQKKRRVNFDFDQLQLFNGFVPINLKKGEAANLGNSSGLGSNASAKQDKSAFFNWISADDRIATARGGGGGLALWKRIHPEQNTQ